jgi:hypothetical protein
MSTITTLKLLTENLQWAVKLKVLKSSYFFISDLYFLVKGNNSIKNMLY